MQMIQSILMGITQGLTEFLPVSSSGHLVLTSSLYKLFTGEQFVMEGSQEAFFDIILHLGTLLAILIYYRKDIVDITKKFIEACKNKDFSSSDAKFPVFILISTFMTIILAFPLKDVVKSLLVKPMYSGIFLVVTAIVLYLSEYMSKKKNINTDKISMKSAILIGLAQGLAVFPGLSRSGMTIATGLFNGLDRVTCARYSFLLSVPIILGASIFYPIIEIDMHDFMTFNWTAIIVGFVISAIVGYFCIKYFIKFLAKFSLNIFSYYCLIVGTLMIVCFNKI